MFQSTRPRGTRPLKAWKQKSPAGFQSTRPRGTRLSTFCWPVFLSSFNPRVRAGRDFLVADGLNLVMVSIHASARDATPSCSAGRGAGQVSIHASARDATPILMSPARLSRVSIHASARDATFVDFDMQSRFKFQSTRPRGTRRVRCYEQRGKRRFQSTRPRGTRRFLSIYVHSFQSFNPRVRAGRDVTDYFKNYVDQVSIHASARDATITSPAESRQRKSFNPRVRAGRDLSIVTKSVSITGFQSTRPRGTRRQ